MTLDNKQIETIKRIISENRINSYRLTPQDADELLLKRYLFNVEISETLYPILSAIEIALRNNLFNAIAFLKGNNWISKEVLRQDVLLDNERQLLLDANKKLLKNHKRISEGDLVAELSFGFWVNLCKKAYKNGLWDKPGFFKMVFGDFDKHFTCSELDKTKTIFPELKNALLLRNRVFHHEIIINDKRGLEKVYQTLEQILFSLSEEYANYFTPCLKFKAKIKQKP